MKEWLKHLIELYEENSIPSNIYTDKNGKKYLFIDVNELEEINQLK